MVLLENAQQLASLQWNTKHNLYDYTAFELILLGLCCLSNETDNQGIEQYFSQWEVHQNPPCQRADLHYTILVHRRILRSHLARTGGTNISEDILLYGSTVHIYWRLRFLYGSLPDISYPSIHEAPHKGNRPRLSSRQVSPLHSLGTELQSPQRVIQDYTCWLNW